MIRHRTKWLAARVCGFVACLLLTGCGPREGTVTGKVTLDGTPVEKGSITFLPVDGDSATAGEVITNGTYTVAMPPGKKKVEIRAPKVIGQRKAYDSPESPVIDEVAESIPDRYNAQTTLTIEVKPGKSEHSFELTTQTP